MPAKLWPFTSLGPAKKVASHERSLAGIVFDVDGTLCLPQNYMFKEMRDVLGIKRPKDILEHINELAQCSEEQAERAREAIRIVERRAMAKQTPQPGLTELMRYLDSKGVKRAIVTRNFDEPVRHLLTRYLEPIDTADRPRVNLSQGLRGFWPILTREFTPPKPAPDPLLHIAREWHLPERERCARMIMVGDSADDVASGSAAGATTIILGNRENEDVAADWRIDHLVDLIALLEGTSAAMP